MSVFQLEDWWSVHISNGQEEFDFGCMSIGNVDNVQPVANKIVIGSLEGTLRIYNPCHPKFRVEDLVLEEALGLPILQVSIGLFIPSSVDHVGIAVLHPRKLAVYEVIAQGGKDGRVNFHSLQLLYEHNLGLEGGKHFTAHSMIHGSFGNSTGREMIAVESMDGKIQIFEQSSVAFTRQMADCLVPGVLWYWSRTDSFVISNHATQLESYKYQVLSSAQGNIGTSSAQDKEVPAITAATTGMFHVSAVRGAMMEWSLHTGELCRQIVDGHFSGVEKDRPGGLSSQQVLSGSNNNNNNHELLVLCDMSLHLLKESGAVLQQRRLEVEPSCICAFRPTNGPGKGSGDNFILANQDRTIQVFRNFNIVWAAKVPAVPVQVAVSAFADKSGLIVTVDETGLLSVSYLGTRPPVNAVAVNSNKREVDYDKIDEEHRALLQVIRDAQSESKTEPKDKLLIRAQMPRSLDLGVMTLSASDRQQQDFDLSFKLPDDLAVLKTASAEMLSDNKPYVKICIRVYLSYSGDQTLGDVSVVPVVPQNQSIYVFPKSVVLQKTGASRSTPVLTKFYFYVSRACLPSSPDIFFYANYVSPVSNEPRITSTAVSLPLYLYCQPKPPTKSASTAPHKIIVDILDDIGESNNSSNNNSNGVLLSKTSWPLTDLFEDYLFSINDTGLIDVRDSLGPTAAQAIGFQFYATHALDIDKAAQILAKAGASLTAGQIEECLHVNDNNSNNSNDSNQQQQPPSMVSVVSSKTNGRYKVQSDSLPAMFLILSELEKRLNLRINTTSTTYSSNSDNNSNNVVVVPKKILSCSSEPLPLEEWFVAVDVHFKTRQLLIQQLSQLNDRSHQYRMIQKRLLVRYKERNPTPLAGIDIVLNETYQIIVTLADAVEANQRRLKLFQQDLVGIARYVILVAGIKFNLDAAERKAIEGYFCLDCSDGLEQGWEEIVDASLTYLLKTALAKNVKESATISNSNLEMPHNTDLLKKHITMVFDRISKGARISPATTASTTSTGEATAVGGGGGASRNNGNGNGNGK